MSNVIPMRKIIDESEFGGGDENDDCLVCPECEGTNFVLLDHGGDTVVVTCANPDCQCEVWDIEDMDVE